MLQFDGRRYRIALLVLVGSLGGESAFAQEPESEKPSHDSQNASAAVAHAGGGEMAMGHHAMAHPFLAHMGIPDGPGEANVRLTGLWRVGHEESGADGGLHIEAGLLPRWGFHFRSDVMTAKGFGASHGDEGHAEEGGEEQHDESEAGHGHVPSTELMLMYSVLQSEDKTRGISVFGQLAWPVVRGAEEAEETITTAAGLGGRYMLGNRFLIDGNIHVEPAGSVHGEYEIGLMWRPGRQVFLILEDRGTVSRDDVTSYLLPAIKYRFGEIAVGLGSQFPISGEDYEFQTMAQLDLGFM